MASWVISGRPPEIVGPSEKSHGPLSAQQLAQLVEKARQQGIPDVVIGDCRVIAIGEAWQHEGHVRALQQLLLQRRLDQLALVDRREPWYKRLWAQLWGPAET